MLPGRKPTAIKYLRRLIAEGRIDRHYRPIPQAEQTAPPSQLPLFLD